MPRRVVRSTDGNYRGEPFLKLRLAERKSFPCGVEVEIEFTGRDAFESFGMARQAARIYAGLVTPTGEATTVPFASDLGPYQGRVLGRQTADTKQGWRIDWNPRTGELHVNWWDRRLDASPKGNRDKSKHFFGANYVTGGTQHLFWEIEAHFPGQVEPKK